MKKVLSILLSILMVTTVFQGLTITAVANGERDTERPNNSEHSYLDVICPGQRHTIYYRGECDFDFIPTGMSYDLDSNTLYLDNCNEPDWIISTGEMGNSFTISVEGNNYIRAITANADKHTNSINITGNGHLHNGRQL